MKASLRWLEGFLRKPLDARDVAARLGMLGAPVDSITKVGPDLDQFVVGLVTDVRPHPGADKLRVTTVDDGSGTMWNVVCGAPNVTAGVRYPFARLGTTMPGGLVIERRKLRGEFSEGMLCSARELGLGEDHEGILPLDTDLAPGSPLTAVISGGDQQLEVDVTPNRPDLLGHKGIAREIAISLRAPFRLPDLPGVPNLDVPPPAKAGATGETGGVTVEIIDAAGCGRFLGGVVRGVKVGPSPKWLVERLEGAGVRSINNVVDVTNYVMLELNQPMHAYDVTTLRGDRIVARAAGTGESVVTLDGVTRKLPEGAVVIADAERAIGIAGVMGGLDTEVTDTTTDIFLECAWFDPSRVRAARVAVNLSTDASHRFERGTDRWGAVDAFRRALRMLVGICGGRVDGDTVDCVPETVHPPRIFLRPSRVAQVLGVALEWREIERCLVAIGCTIVSKPDDARIAVDVPGWRPDLTGEIDLVEEIARVHGYDEIPVELRGARPGNQVDDPLWGAAARVRSGLASLGLAEVMTLPMTDADDSRSPRILNPLSADHGRLRSQILPAVVREVERNWAAGTGDVRLFEIGTVFEQQGDGKRPTERLMAAFAVTGARHPRHWSTAQSTDEWNRWDARWLVEQLAALAAPGVTVVAGDDCWLVNGADGTPIGWCGRLEADAPRWAGELWGGAVQVIAADAAVRKFAPLPAYPAVTRDLALLVALGRPVADVTGLLLERGRRHALTDVAVVDEFRGGDIPAGRRSVVVRLRFRADDRTLVDSEVEKAVGRLISSLERELDVTLRSS